MSNYYNQKPSELLEIEDGYVAHCLDAVCFYISQKIQNGDTPIFNKTVKSFADIYKDFD